MSNNNRPEGKEAERRMSGPSTSRRSLVAKENRKPFQAVLSEEIPLLSTLSPQTGPSTSQPVRQSFLSKLTRNEGNKTGASSGLGTPIREQHQQQSSQSARLYGTECDISSPFKNANNDLISFDTLKQNVGASRPEDLTSQLEKKNLDAKSKNGDKLSGDTANQGMREAEEEEDEDNDDDDNQVIPSWPSKGDAAAVAATNRASGYVQHKVFSLKDYSQVAHPSATSTNQSASTSSGGRLLKSLSQDRRADSQGFQSHIDSNRSKRLSECPYPGLSAATGLRQMSMASTSSKQLDPSVPRPNAQASASFSVGPATSFATRHPAVLMNESRIDRVRKLFVSPLSLRSGNAKHGAQITNHTSTASTRLSFQSGSNMLNKPQHLMHAIYRTGGMAGPHSRRSPMRQKQGKSFRLYGCPLHMANNIYPITCFGRADIYKQQSVPYVLARLCNYIEENSSQLTHEGIFRVSGNARLMEKLRTLFDHLGDAPLESESVDVATSASMLKMYLRELPEPLIPTRMNYYFITLAKKYSPFLIKENATILSKTTTPLASSTSVPSKQKLELALDSQNERQRVAFSRDLTKLLRKLPIENYNLLKYLACFLYRISLKQQYNKMCAEALGIVFGPNVFRIRSESYKGLKEQELSNQIMASIISNYKCIFDSELTDPLGNLVDVGTNKVFNVVSDYAGTTKPDALSQASAETDARPSTSGSCPRNASNNSMPPNSTIIQNISSKVDLKCYPDKPSGGLEYDGKVVVSAREQEYEARKLVHDDDDDDEDEDADDEEELEGAEEDKTRRLVLDERDEDDFDLDEDDLESENDDCDESYTPSSGSESYCSSMDDSETLESSYDADEDRGDMEVNSNASSSECRSDTSYTPTSSHTDSEAEPYGADETNYGQSNSFESIPSMGGFIKPALDNSTDGQEQAPTKLQITSQRKSSQIEGQKGCLVCTRRRESAAAQLGVQGISLIESSTSGEVYDKKPQDKDDHRSSATLEAQYDNPLVSRSEKPQSASTKEDSEPILPIQQAMQGEHKSISRTSRRRRADIQKKHADQTNKADIPFSTESAAASQHTYAIPPQPIRIHRQQDPATGIKARYPNKQVSSKFDFLRRRSSSASSLSRIRHRRGQTAQHKKSLKGNHLRSDRLHDARGSQNSTRRSKNKTHIPRRLTNQPAQLSSTSRQTAKDSAVPPTRHSDRPRIKSDSHYVPLASENVSALNLSAHLVVEDNEPFLSGWDFLSAQYLEELDYDKYFMLRPYNSDETLLRSSSFCSEMAAQARANPIMKPRRRYSGVDFDNKIGLVQVCRPCDQIFEGYEEEAAVAAAAAAALVLAETPQEDGGGLKDPSEFMASGLKVEQGNQPVEASLESSCVSLLDNNRLPGFRKSELSITAELDVNQETDSMLAQVRACKALLSCLKRLSSYTSLNGYSMATRSVVSDLVQDHSQNDPEAYSSDCHVCNVDYLSAIGVIEQLEQSLKFDSDDHLAATEPFTSILNAALDIKMASLKQRYRDLRNIHDHHLRNHQPVQAETFEKTNIDKSADECSINQDESSKTISKGVHGSLDTLRPYNYDLECGTGLDSRERKLSAPSEDPKRDENLAKKRQPSAKGQQSNRRATSARTQTGGSGKPQRVISSREGSMKAASSKTSGAGSVRRRDRSSSGCRFGSLCPVEFVFNIEERLASKRNSGNRVVKLNEMNIEQLQSEKLELQKNLLRYEHWFGRPATRLECSLVGHLYERYRAVKIIKSRKQRQLEQQQRQPQNQSNENTTIEC